MLLAGALFPDSPAHLISLEAPLLAWRAVAPPTPILERRRPTATAGPGLCQVTCETGPQRTGTGTTSNLIRAKGCFRRIPSMPRMHSMRWHRRLRNRHHKGKPSQPVLPLSISRCASATFPQSLLPGIWQRLLARSPRIGSSLWISVATLLGEPRAKRLLSSTAWPMGTTQSGAIMAAISTAVDCMLFSRVKSAGPDAIMAAISRPPSTWVTVDHCLLLSLFRALPDRSLTLARGT